MSYWNDIHSHKTSESINEDESEDESLVGSGRSRLFRSLFSIIANRNGQQIIYIYKNFNQLSQCITRINQLSTLKVKAKTKLKMKMSRKMSIISLLVLWVQQIGRHIKLYTFLQIIKLKHLMQCIALINHLRLLRVHAKTNLKMNRVLTREYNGYSDRCSLG